jgi:hypothetical protein
MRIFPLRLALSRLTVVIVANYFPQKPYNKNKWQQIATYFPIIATYFP